ERGRVQPSQLLPVAGPSVGAVLEALEPEELVGRVVVLVGRREGEEHGLRADLTEDEADRNGGTHADAQRRLMVDLRQDLLGEREAGMIAGYLVGLGAVIAGAHVQRDAARAAGPEMVGDGGDNVIRTLSRDEPAGDLGVRFAGDHRLRARALVATPEAVDLEGGPQPH